MALKAGSVSNIANSLAKAMDDEMAVEWQAVYGVPLPSQGSEQRQLLFVAVARGLLKYLKQHEDEVLSHITLREMGGLSSEEQWEVTHLDINA